MKKILFLMLSLAVSASAFAGINKTQPISQEKKAVAQLIKASPSKVMFKAANPFVQDQRTPLATVDRAEKMAKGDLRAVITEQPEGEVKYYQRTGGNSIFRYYDSTASSPWGSVTEGDQEGMVMAVQNGSTIWFKNLLYDPDGYWDDYWIEGTISGTRVTIATGQHIYYSSNYDAFIAISMGTLTYSSGFSFEKNSNPIRFNISGDKLTLANSSYDGNYGGTCLSTYWTDDDTWGAFADFETVLEIDTTTPQAPEMYTDDDIDAMTGGNLELYYRTGNAFYTTNGEDIYYGDGAQYGTIYIYYAADGSTIYMRDPVFGARDLHKWVKGTISGNKITVPLGQYLAWTSDFVGMKTAWGEVTLTTTDEGNYVDFAADETVTECTYTIDGKMITLDGTSEYVGLATVLDSAYVDIENGWWPNLDYSTTYYKYPGTPENLSVTPAATTADLAWDDEENSMWTVRYRVYNPALAAAYSNDFEESLAGWGVSDGDGDGDTWGWYGDPDDDNNAMMASLSYNLTPENYLFSADVLPVEGSVVSFNAWGWNGTEAGSQETFDIYCVPVNAESDDDILVIAEGVTTNGDKTTVYSYNIPEACIGDSCYIAFCHTGGAGYLCIDNFFVGNPDATPNPWVYINNVTENPYTIEGLTAETTYEVQVQGVNEGGFGDWSEMIAFTTLSAVLRGDVDDNGTVNISDVTALINHLLSQQWDSVPGEFSYDNADCDESGSVTIADVTALINYLLSKKW